MSNRNRNRNARRASHQTHTDAQKGYLLCTVGWDWVAEFSILPRAPCCCCTCSPTISTRHSESPSLAYARSLTHSFIRFSRSRRAGYWRVGKNWLRIENRRTGMPLHARRSAAAAAAATIGTDLKRHEPNSRVSGAGIWIKACFERRLHFASRFPERSRSLAVPEGKVATRSTRRRGHSWRFGLLNASLHK